MNCLPQDSGSRCFAADGNSVVDDLHTGYPYEDHAAVVDKLRAGDRDDTCERLPLCCGCDGVIEDRYYLVAVEGLWHSECLKCVECCNSLESETSCFMRDNKIYCRIDYHR